MMSECVGTVDGNAGSEVVVRAGMSGAGSEVGWRYNACRHLRPFYMWAGHRHGSVAAVIPN